jgi:mRNA interferase MazF
MNRHLHTVIVAPMTTSGRAYPSRVAVSFGGRDGLVALDQLRTIDRARIVSVAGSVDPPVRNRVLLVLREMFAE